MSTHKLRRLEHLTFELIESPGRHLFVAGKLSRGVPRVEAMGMRCDVCKARHVWEPATRAATEITDALAARAECRRWLERHWSCGANGKPVPVHFGDGPVTVGRQTWTDPTTRVGGNGDST